MPMSRINNFDLIRLLAAIQVMVLHVGAHLHVQYSDATNSFLQLIKFFPGVPVFFTISGFLILWSYERNKNQFVKFYYNRILRIYPALLACLFLTLCLLLSFGIINMHQLLSKDIVLWLLAQATFFQFYTPDILRSFGVGTPNGSLWTISLELQFYAIIPVLYYLFFQPTRVRIQYLMLIFVMGISIGVYVWASALPEEELLSKCMSVFVLPYLYNFIFGMIIYKYWAHFKNMIEGKGWYWLAFYLLYSLVFSSWAQLYTPDYWPNLWGFGANLILAIMVISIAYTATSYSNKLLKGRDFSYGIYIYHMLVVNVFVQLGYLGSYEYLLLTFGLTLILAMCSWFLVERLALKWK